MTQEQWDQVFKLFHESLDKTPSERLAYLDAHCQHAVIRAEVQSLLANADGADTVLNSPAIAGAREAIDAALKPPDSGREALISELTGAVISDRYQIVECIGRGGQAIVLLALDRRIADRKVVVKVLDGEQANRD